MEIMLAFVGVVNETLLIVSEQILRKSYGISSLEATITLWENLFQQLRVSIVLSGHLDLLQETKCSTCVRDFDTKFLPASTERLRLRNCSVYRVLALDTLSFDVRVDHSVEHERQCRTVYTKRIQQIEAGAASGHRKEGDSAPTAWGPSADSSWRELLPLPHTTSDEHPDRPRGKTKPVSKKRARRPLLLYFPLHNQPSTLGAYRAMEHSVRCAMRPALQALNSIFCCDFSITKSVGHRNSPFINPIRWTRHPHRIELLRAAGEHLLSLSAVTRGAVAGEIFEESLLPLLRRLIALRTRDQPSEDRVGTFEVCLVLCCSN